MAVRDDGYDYDEYTVYISLPPEMHIEDVLRAGMKSLVLPDDDTVEAYLIDSHYN